MRRKVGDVKTFLRSIRSVIDENPSSYESLLRPGLETVDGCSARGVDIGLCRALALSAKESITQPGLSLTHYRMSFPSDMRSDGDCPIENCLVC